MQRTARKRKKERPRRLDDRGFFMRVFKVSKYEKYFRGLFEIKNEAATKRFLKKRLMERLLFGTSA